MKQIEWQVLNAVPTDRAVPVRAVRRAVPGIRAEQARRILDALCVRGLCAETVDGRYVRTSRGAS